MMALGDLRGVHHKAMEYMDSAHDARRNGDTWGYRHYASLAFDTEWEVAQSVDGNLDRAVLSRSAAWCAIHAQRWDDAQKAIDYGLSGEYVPEEIEAELKEAQAELDKLRSEHHA